MAHTVASWRELHLPDVETRPQTPCLQRMSARDATAAQRLVEIDVLRLHIVEHAHAGIPAHACCLLPFRTGFGCLSRDLASVGPAGSGGRLGGAVDCAPAVLPFENAAFELVLAQHAGDALPDEGFAEELSRVLAPGGVLLWYAFNPWSPWLAWIHWQTRGSAAPPFANADTQRRRFVRARLAPVSTSYVGACSPTRREAAAITDDARSRLLAPLRGAYLLVVRKQRASLTPLRPRVKHASVALGARLAGTPSQRASA